MRFHVRVEPVPDEPLTISKLHAVSGLTWLKRGLDTGKLEAAEAFPQTGGYMIIEAPGFGGVTELLADYPLLSTIRLDINRLLTLDEGFAVLLDAIERRERIIA